MIAGGDALGMMVIWGVCGDIVVFQEPNLSVFVIYVGIDDGHDVNHDLLAGIFERVQSCEFKPASDHVSQVARVEQMITGKKLALVSVWFILNRQSWYKSINDFIELFKSDFNVWDSRIAASSMEADRFSPFLSLLFVVTIFKMCLGVN